MSMDGAVNLGTAYGDIQIDLSGTAKQFDQAIDGIEKSVTASMEKIGKKFDDFGQNLTMLSAPMTALMGLSIKMAKDFEYQFADVVKTVDATDEQLDALYNTIRTMATDASNPLSSLDNAHATLAEIMSLGGQLGIATADLEDFTTTIGALGVATNLTTDMAATQLAQIANITGLASDEFANFAGALVQIGNNSATTERDIMNMMSRIALAGTQVRLSEQTMLALSGAISSAGISAELGGTNFSKFLSQIEKDVAIGGDTLQRWANMAGLSAEKFGELWSAEDSTPALIKIIEGMSNMGSADLLLWLDDVNITSAEMQKVIGSLAQNFEGFNDTLEHSSKGWEEANAHIAEAEQKADTVQGAMNRMRNTLQNVGISLGNALLPPLEELINLIQPIINGFADWAEKNPKIIKAVAGLSFAITGLGLAFVAVGKAMVITSGVIGSIGLLLNPVALAVGAISGAVIGLAKLWSDNFAGIQTATKKFIGGISAIIHNFGLLLSGDIFYGEFVKTTKENLSSMGKWVQWFFNNLDLGFDYVFSGTSESYTRLFDAVKRNSLSALNTFLSMRKAVVNITKSITVFRKSIGYVGDALKIALTGDWENTFSDMYDTLGLLPGGLRQLLVDVNRQLNVGITGIRDNIRRRAGDIKASWDYLLTGDDRNLWDELVYKNMDFNNISLAGKLLKLRAFIVDFVDQIPQMFSDGTDIVNNIASGIGDLIRQGIERIPDLLIMGAEFLPKLLAGLFFGKQLVKGWIIENVIVPIGTEIYNGFMTISDDAGTWGRTVLDTFVNSIKTTADWLYNEMLKPFVDMLETKGSNAVDGAFNLGGDIIQGLIDGAKGIGDWFYNDVIVPMSDYIAKHGPKFIEDFTQIIRDISANLGRLTGELLAKFLEILPDLIILGAKILGAFLKGLGDLAVWVGTNVVAPFLGGLLEKFPKILRVGMDLIGELLQGILDVLATGAQWVDENIIQPFFKWVTGGEGTLSDAGIKLAQSLMDGLLSVLSGVAGEIDRNVLQPALKVVRDITNAVSGVFGGGGGKVTAEMPTNPIDLYMGARGQGRDRGGTGNRGALYHVGDSQIGYEAFIAGDNGHFYPDFARELAYVAGGVLAGQGGAVNNNQQSTTINITVQNPSGGYNAGRDFGAGLGDEITRKIRSQK